MPDKMATAMNAVATDLTCEAALGGADRACRGRASSGCSTCTSVFSSTIVATFSAASETMCSTLNQERCVRAGFACMQMTLRLFHNCTLICSKEYRCPDDCCVQWCSDERLQTRADFALGKYRQSGSRCVHTNQVYQPSTLFAKFEP